MTQERASLREMSDALPALRDDLVREYGASVPTAAIEEAARQALAEFDGVPIREIRPRSGLAARSLAPAPKPLTFGFRH